MWRTVTRLFIRPWFWKKYSVFLGSVPFPFSQCVAAAQSEWSWIQQHLPLQLGRIVWHRPDGWWDGTVGCLHLHPKCRKHNGSFQNVLESAVLYTFSKPLQTHQWKETILDKKQQIRSFTLEITGMSLCLHVRQNLGSDGWASVQRWQLNRKKNVLESTK